MTKLIDWIKLKDYEAAKENATKQIEERLSRGNTSAQNGSSMEEDELLALSIRADASMRKLQSLAIH